MSSVIDLLDSSEDEDVKDTKPSPPCHDDSSSSSDDDILYAPSIFSNAQSAGKNSGGKTEGDVTIKPAVAPAKKSNSYYSTFGAKRKLHPSKTENDTKKKPKASDDDIIELGSSSEGDTPQKPEAKSDALSDYFSHPNFHNKVVKKNQVKFDSSGEDNSVSSDDSRVNVPTAGADWAKQSTAIRNPYILAAKKKNDFSSTSAARKTSTAGDDVTNNTKRKTAPNKNSSVFNPYKRMRNPTPKCYQSDGSSATKSLPDSDNEKARAKSPPEKLLQKAPPTEIDLSTDTNDENDHKRPRSDYANNSQSNGIDWSFDAGGGFYDDGKSINQHDSHKRSMNLSFDAGVGFDKDDCESSDYCLKPKVKPVSKPNKEKSFTLIDVDEVDLDDDNGSDSSRDIPMFTPKPFKKNKGADKISSTAAAAASFALSTSKSGEDLDDASSSSELRTPREFSPPSSSPLTTFATRKKVPVPAIPAMPLELINEIGGKLYPDLKHLFLIALAHHARKARHASYERGTFDSALRSIIVLTLHLRPLRSPEAARRIKGVGGAMYELLKETASGPNAKAPFVPKQNKYSCVAAAALVSLLELEEENRSPGACFAMEDLISKINQLLDSRAQATLSQTVDKYLDPNTLDPNWGQVKKLCSSNSNADVGGPFMKERKKKQACASGVVFELLDIGREMAIKLRELARGAPVEPGPLRQLPNDTVDEEFGSVTMSMDFREGGGAGKGLHKMCDSLDTRGVPYVVRELKIADYVFFIGEKLAPILIERKTAEDVASSLHDGRWERQQRSMRKAQFVLGGGEERRCQICYIIEGDPNKKKVHGGNVGRRSWFQGVEDVENAIAKLPELGFGVMRSKGHLDTVGLLAKIAADVSWKFNNGSIDVKYTYEQFLRQVKALNDDKGDPPTSSEHKNPAAPVETVNLNPQPSSSSTSNTNREAPAAAGAQQNPGQTSAQNGEAVAELEKLSIQALKERCKERGEKIGGKKADLIARLLQPRKPEILIMRMRRNDYVPKIPSSNAALMVALLLHHVPGTQGITKERLMVLAEETGVSKESMSGDGGFYDGWSGMKQLQEGDPALVRREKGHRYSLTTQPPESSGVAVARALHILAHREGICTCGGSAE